MRLESLIKWQLTLSHRRQVMIISPYSLSGSLHLSPLSSREQVQLQQTVTTNVKTSKTSGWRQEDVYLGHCGWLQPLQLQVLSDQVRINRCVTKMLLLMSFLLSYAYCWTALNRTLWLPSWVLLGGSRWQAGGRAYLLYLHAVMVLVMRNVRSTLFSQLEWRTLLPKTFVPVRIIYGCLWAITENGLIEYRQAKTKGAVSEQDCPERPH